MINTERLSDNLRAYLPHAFTTSIPDPAKEEELRQRMMSVDRHSDFPPPPREDVYQYLEPSHTMTPEEQARVSLVLAHDLSRYDRITPLPGMLQQRAHHRRAIYEYTRAAQDKHLLRNSNSFWNHGIIPPRSHAFHHELANLWVQYHVQKLAHRTDPVPTPNGLSIPYAVDVGGDNGKDRYRYLFNEMVDGRNFMESPGKTPLTLTVNPDNRCGGCIFGNHCHGTRGDQFFIYSQNLANLKDKRMHTVPFQAVDLFVLKRFTELTANDPTSVVLERYILPERLQNAWDIQTMVASYQTNLSTYRRHIQELAEYEAPHAIPAQIPW